MACSVNLKSFLGTSDSGGTWAPGAPDGGDCTTLINTNPQAIAISGGDLGTIDVSAALAGTYEFTYVVGSPPCVDCATVTVTVNDGAVINGTVTAESFCDNDNTDYNLFSRYFTVGTSTDGTWSNTGTLSSGYKGNGVAVGAGTPGNPQDDTFNPDLAGVGVYPFTYTVNHGDGTTPGGCDNCTETYTITLTVTALGNAGTNASVTLCNA